MSNGKQAISDLAVLEYYGTPYGRRPSFGDFAKANGMCYKQLYSHLNKRRFMRWINYGVSLEGGWLEESGKAELAKLRSGSAP